MVIRNMEFPTKLAIIQGNLLRGIGKKTVIQKRGNFNLFYIYVLFSVTHFLLHNKMVQIAGFYIYKNSNKYSKL